MISADPNPDVPWTGWTFCRVCGVRTMVKTGLKDDDHRCLKHRGRNPCVIEGCQRTLKAPASGRLSVDDVLCGEHWRQFVPVGSPERRIYNRFFRKTKRYGWTNESTAAFYRFWRRLVAKARSRSSGDLDVAEINRVMGW